MSDAYTDTDLALSASAVGLLDAWPNLRTNLVDIYTAHVSRLPFVPAGWLDGAVAHLHAADAAVWLPTPSPLSPPAWLNSPEALSAWKTLFDALESAVNSYAAGEEAAGAAALASLNASAEFWNGLYVAAKAIADAPSAVLSAAGSVADSIVGGIFSSGVGKVLLIGGLIAAGVAVYVLFPAAKKVAIGKVSALA